MSLSRISTRLFRLTPPIYGSIFHLTSSTNGTRFNHYEGDQHIIDLMLSTELNINQFKKSLIIKYKYMEFSNFNELYTHLAINDKNALYYNDSLGRTYKLVLNCNTDTFEWEIVHYNY
jgi:hypothetical protein